MIRIDQDRIVYEINKLIRDSGMSLKTMGREIGVTDATVSRIANRIYIPSLDTISLLAAYLKRDVLDFFETSDEYLNLSRLPKNVRGEVERIVRIESQESR